jgi:ABC-2 type transport system permease protein
MNARWLRLFWRQVDVQLRIRTFDPYSLLLFFLQPAIFSGVGMVLSRAAGQAQPDLVYTVIGGGMLGMWSGLVFTSTFDITRDRRDGTLELIVASPTSLAMVEAFRTFTNVVAGLASMAAAVAAAIFLFDYPLAAVDLPGALVSLGMIVFGMWSIGVFLANFPVWSRITGSYVEFLEIPVALVCGFMYPIGILPGWMQAISTAIPIRWALEALDAALLGTGGIEYYLRQWGMALALSLLFWGLAHWLGLKIHDRIRVSGEMSAI